LFPGLARPRATTGERGRSSRHCWTPGAHMRGHWDEIHPVLEQLALVGLPRQAVFQLPPSDESSHGRRGGLSSAYFPQACLWLLCANKKLPALATDACRRESLGSGSGSLTLSPVPSWHQLCSGQRCLGAFAAIHRSSRAGSYPLHPPLRLVSRMCSASGKHSICQCLTGHQCGTTKHANLWLGGILPLALSALSAFRWPLWAGRTV